MSPGIYPSIFLSRFAGVTAVVFTPTYLLFVGGWILSVQTGTVAFSAHAHSPLQTMNNVQNSPHRKARIYPIKNQIIQMLPSLSDSK